MRKILILLIVNSLVGCSLVGIQLGKSVDKITKKTDRNYESKYFAEGLEADVEIVKKLLENDKKERVEYDDRACKKPGTRQICTFKKGCWCEET